MGQWAGDHPAKGLPDMSDMVPSDGRLQTNFVRSGVVALANGDFISASKAFNRALKFDPQNANLHFLNGLAYHLRAATGDGSQFEFADTGYRVALQFDPSNHWAAYQIGRIKFRQQLYREAQEAFAYALLFDPRNPRILHALAAASYYAQDLATAMTAVSEAERLSPNDTTILQTAAIVRAAAGLTKAASGYLDRYGKAMGTTGFRTAYLTRRLDDWRSMYGRFPGLRLVQDTEPGILGTEGSTIGVGPRGASDDSEQSEDKTDGSLDEKKSPRDMALVDVIIIRSEERHTTNKGVNLLNGLQLQTGTTNATATRSRTQVFAPDTSSTAVNTAVKTITGQLTVPTVTYNLNIFNDNDDRNEVLARPTLVAVEGKPSNFFSGATLHVELAGAAGAEGSLQVLPIGVRLTVTPESIDDDTVQLKVEAARAFIEVSTSNATFDEFIQTTKTEVSANAVMKFGETLILSGLSERETQTVKDGVPILKDIPGVQYVFSNETTLDVTKSVLILLTPHKARYVHRDGTAKVEKTAPPDAKAEQKSLKELKQRVDWFKPAPNLAVVFKHLKDSRLFKEFRSGDVTMERWDKPGTVETMVERALRFLYF